MLVEFSAVQIRMQNWSYEIWYEHDDLRVRRASNDTRSESTHERHPLHVEDIFTRGEVGRHVSADRVSEVLGTPRVELSSRVTLRLACQRAGACTRDEEHSRCWHRYRPRSRRSRRRAAS